MGKLAGGMLRWTGGTILQAVVSVVLVCLPAVVLPATQTSTGGILHIPSAASLAHCPSTCGDVNISYPFGIGPGCFRQGFELTCRDDDDDSARPPRLFLGNTTTATRITDLYDTLAIIVPIYTFFNTCSLSWEWEAPAKGITINSMNIFFVVGCDLSVSLFDHATTRNLVGSCISRCHGGKALPNGGPCNGAGCCFVRLAAENMTGFLAAIHVHDGHCMPTAAAAAHESSDPQDLHHRAVAFLSVDPRYTENATRIDAAATSWIYGAELDVAIVDQPSCQSALMNNNNNNNATYACASGSSCRDAPCGGYYGECSTSYDYFDPVKPYLLEGCGMQGHTI